MRLLRFVRLFREGYVCGICTVTMPACETASIVVTTVPRSAKVHPIRNNYIATELNCPTKLVYVLKLGSQIAEHTTKRLQYPDIDTSDHVDTIRLVIRDVI